MKINIWKELRNTKKHLTALAIIIAVVVITLPVLRIGFVAKHASFFLAESAFYVPDGEKKALNTSMILKAICFGGEASDNAEKIVVLKNGESVANKTSEPSKTDTPVPDTSEQGDIEYNSSLFPIIECDLSSDDCLSLNNTTSKRPNTERLLYSDYDFGYSSESDEPLVLILHTHATESYSRENSTYYDETSSTRSTDNSINMVAVGRVLSETLNNNGISALHCEIKHDAESYRDSYSLAADTIKAYLKEYPSIRYVLDLHRDAVMYDSGAKARPVTQIDGKKAAQVMILVGTDAGGADFPHWEKNLTLALKLTDKLMGEYPSLMRSVALRGASYNEQYTTGSLLIEVGTDGNTLSEAKYSAELLGKALAEMIKGG